LALQAQQQLQSSMNKIWFVFSYAAAAKEYLSNPSVVTATLNALNY